MYILFSMVIDEMIEFLLFLFSIARMHTWFSISPESTFWWRTKAKMFGKNLSAIKDVVQGIEHMNFLESWKIENLAHAES